MGFASSVGRVLGSFASLAVVGFLAIVLGVPVLAFLIALLALVLGLIGAALPFALIGLAVWSICVAVVHRPQGVWRKLGTGVATLIHWLVAVPVLSFVLLCVVGIRGLRAVVGAARPVGRGIGLASRKSIGAGIALTRGGTSAAGHLMGKITSVARLRGVVLETGSGAAVGALLAGLACMGDRGVALGLPIICGAAAGACIGLFVGAARPSFVPQNSSH